MNSASTVGGVACDLVACDLGCDEDAIDAGALATALGSGALPLAIPALTVSASLEQSMKRDMKIMLAS